MIVALNYSLAVPVVLNIKCDSKRPDPIGKEYVCYIHKWRYTNAKEKTYNFLVDYVKPEEIREVRFKEDSITIQHIEPDLFVAFPNLRTLLMTTNLTKVEFSSFVHATNLRTLNLKKNKLTLVEHFTEKSMNTIEKSNDTNYGLSKLENLYLHQNEITDIADYAFYGLEKLFHLKLNDNQLREIRSDAFTGLPALAFLDLSGNRIETIANDALTLPALQLLKLQNNKLRVLSDNIFEQTPQLEEIYVHRNKLEHIGESFTGLTAIEYISLGDNRIGDINLAIFAKLPKLTTLLLSENGFTFAATQLDAQQQWNSPLTLLRIASPNLTDATELKKLKMFPHLKKIDLSDSRFSNFQIDGDQTLKDILPSLEEVSIFSTEIDCKIVQTMIDALKPQNVKVWDWCD